MNQLAILLALGGALGFSSLAMAADIVTVQCTIFSSTQPYLESKLALGLRYRSHVQKLCPVRSVLRICFPLALSCRIHLVFN